MYKVTCLYGGETYTLHDPNSDELRIYDDEVETEDNEPGSFKFTVSHSHPHLDKIVGLSSDIRVYDGEEEIFRGRPIDDGEDLYREREFKCEGELAFLYDSIQPRRELHDITPLQFFTLLVNEHNEQVKGKGPIDKTFTVGVVTVTDSNNSLYRYTNRETTLDDIRDKIIDRLGGHLRVRVSSGKRYLDLIEDVETVSDQSIELGENLLDYAKDTDYTQIATACIPLGARLEETEIAALDAYVTIADANNGSDTIYLTEAVKRYGFICKILHLEDYTVPANLKSAGAKWLEDGQYANMTLELTAVDLHGLGYDVQPIRKNTQIRVVSEPHGMNRYFEVSKRTYHLTEPEADTVTFGTSEKKRSYTSSNKNSVSNLKNQTEQVSRKIDIVIEKERANISNILNQATHGYVVLDPNEGPERILIMDTNSVDTAKKIWKWDMNGLGYSKNGINGPWGVAITMNGQISADYILTGELDASLLKVGKIQGVNGYNCWDLDADELKVGGFKITNTGFWYGNLTSFTSSNTNGVSIAKNGVTVEGYGAQVQLMDGEVYFRSVNSNYEAGIYLGGQNSLHEGSLVVSGIQPFVVMADFVVTGTKSREVKTKDFDDRLLYCVESASPIFSDCGEAVTDHTGECVISLDPIFAQTISDTCEYQVFLQKEGQGDIWVDLKEPTFFIIKGTENLKFAWEIKAKQINYTLERLATCNNVSKEVADIISEEIYCKDIEEAIEEINKLSKQLDNDVDEFTALEELLM